jgi:predicted transcriptional regulator
MRQLVMNDLERALLILGPLEGRIMRPVWTGAVTEPFVVRDIQSLMPELAYTTVMTTLNRLTDKGLLRIEARLRKQAHGYRSAGGPEEFLTRESRDQVQRLFDRFGDAALAAFSERVDALEPDQLERLRQLGKH